MLLPGAIKRLAFLIIIIVATAAFWRYFLYTPTNITPRQPANIAPPTTSSTPPVILNAANNPEPISIDPTKNIPSPPISNAPLPPLKIPSKIKAIYVTAPTASLTSRMNSLYNLADNSEINAFVINIKDGDEIFLTNWMANVVRQLRSKNIYPIARIMIFQDNYLAKTRPDLALKNSAGDLWGKKGYHWVDPASHEVWDYNLNIAKKALDMGFVEVNFDYIRFPDGNVEEIVYPHYDGIAAKEEIIKTFSQYITSEIKKNHPAAIISADVFAYTFLRTNGLGIGQRLTDIAPYYDVIAPMIYPSHYAAGNFGFENPATEPREVVWQTIQSGIFQLSNAQSYPIIRPWIQDFDIGAVYDREKIIAQIQGIRDSGLALNDCSPDAVCGDGWMVWNPSNIYDLNKFQNIEPELLPYPR
ncbi:MAG: putative glycoside hydrolase [Patescibacteria group bacterium]